MLLRLLTRNRDDESGANVILDQHPVQLIFKHSPFCVISAMALEQVERFARAVPTLPIAVIDVVRQRALSGGIAVRTGVRHESPQVLLVAGGRVRWHASHGTITVAALSRAVEVAAVTGSDERGAS